MLVGFGKSKQIGFHVADETRNSEQI